jgi:D-serine deaminase-like pyridoxal phosphate-dependent protein
MSLLADLDTPAALVDEPRLAAALARMQARMNALGVALRPHVKTAKCIEVARRQRAAGARGITVSTLKEAEQFFAAGFDDILYAVGLAPQRTAHVFDLLARGARLKVVVDSVAAAQAVVEATRRTTGATDATGASLTAHTNRGALGATATAPAPRPEVLIEIDTDGHRAGVEPESPLLLEIARVLHGDGGNTHPGSLLAGVMTHCGASYDCRGAAALEAMAEQERSRCVRAAKRLRAAGLPCPVVSVGSTPTALFAKRLDGVTEVRAGVYVFYDLVMAGLGVCAPEDIALSILTTVIGHQPSKGWVLTDGGWMAMSRDRGTQAQPLDQGYGLVCDEAGRVIGSENTGAGDWIVNIANQEHGIVEHRRGAAAAGNVAARFPVGTRLRVLPNHACATAAQHDHYAVVRDGAVRECWARFGGW